MYTKEHIRSLLSSNDQIIFDQIENHTLLGASNHIKAIGTMIENLANSDNTPDQIIHNIKLVCNYYIQTRGKASQAISNAIFIMISNIDKINLNSSEFRINIINNKNNYFDISSKNQQLCQRSDKRKYLARNNHVHTLSLLDACFCACPRLIPVNNTAYRTNSAHPSLWDTYPFRNNRLRLNAISPHTQYAHLHLINVLQWYEHCRKSP